MIKFITLYFFTFIFLTNTSAQVIVPNDEFIKGSYNLKPIHTCQIELKKNLNDSKKEDLILKLTTKATVFSTKLLNEEFYLFSINESNDLSHNDNNSNSEFYVTDNEVIYKRNNKCFNMWSTNIKYSDDELFNINEVIIKRKTCRIAKVLVGLLTPEYYGALGLKKPTQNIKCKFKK